MTTINNDQSLIEKVGGIDRAREIVDGAPESNFPVKWCLVRKKYVRQVGFNTQHLVNGEWIDEFNVNPWADLDSLRTAIAKHDEFKVGDSIVANDESLKKVFVILAIEYGTLYKVAKASFFEIGSFRHATPDEVKAGHRLEAERHG